MRPRTLELLNFETVNGFEETGILLPIETKSVSILCMKYAIFNIVSVN